MSFSEQDLEEFKAENLEFLDIAEKSLLSLDSGADFKSAFDAIFRGFHNLKGAAGMLELHQLQAHTHELESILMQFKAASSMPKSYVDFFLRGIDAAKALLAGEKIEFDYKISDEATTEPTPHNVSEPAAPEVKASAPSQPKAELPQEALDEFVAETDETVDRLSKNLQLIEGGQVNKETIDKIYRDVHSLKGSSYLFSFSKLGDLAHAMESSLEKVREGTHLPSKALYNGLFKSLEVIEKLMQRVRSKSEDDDLEMLVQMFSEILTNAAEKLEPAPAVSVAPVPSQVVVVAEEPAKELAQEPAPQVSAAAVKIEKPALKSERPAGASASDSSHPETAPASNQVESASSIRVSVALLDNLMTLMGEMVLVRNQVLQYANRSEDLEFVSMSKRLNVVTSEIQGEMMKTRMQPIGNVLNKFNRVVRDLSQDLQKSINITLAGNETELDKSLLEAIKDPLTHIVRNSCDHGIEAPDVRRKSGKSEAGTIQIKAYHEGGQVIIDVSDDGKGLHKDVILKKAIEKGILSQAEGARLSEKEIFNLIFAPGFSTAAKITNVSGRGVGMDVVRTNIEKIGGTVDLSSVAGEGTTIKIKIPLTLAIIPALIVKSAGGTFAIPQVKLEELVRVDQSNAENRLECLHGVPVLRLRGTILPLVDLNQVLKSGTLANYKDGIVNIAVVNAEQSSFGLIIDEVQDTADIVVKPINRLIKSLQIYSGATILGNGSVALILDVVGVSKVAQIGQERGKNIESELRSDDKNRGSAEAQDYLLVQVNSPTKHAIVLGYVQRLEEFSRSQIELSGAQPVIRYRDVILPLLSANKLLRYEERESQSDIIHVVVIQRAGKLYGIQVEKILDTLSSTVELDPGYNKQVGIFGNLNTPEELIVVIDPFEVINKAFPEEPKARETRVVATTPQSVAAPPAITGDKLAQLGSASVGATSSGARGRVLLAEDTVFFRKAIKAALEKGGFEVTTARDGKEAIEILNREESPFHLIVSDIEMPRMNGFQLAEAVRKHSRHGKTPMLAVSSRADSSFIAEGKRAGFDVYQEKFKPDMLLAAITELLEQKRSVA